MSHLIRNTTKRDIIGQIAKTRFANLLNSNTNPASTTVAFLLNATLYAANALCKLSAKHGCIGMAWSPDWRTVIGSIVGDKRCSSRPLAGNHGLSMAIAWP